MYDYNESYSHQKYRNLFTERFNNVTVRGWDPKKKKDENTSIWMRVSQPWAGSRKSFVIEEFSGDSNIYIVLLIVFLFLIYLCASHIGPKM